MESIYSTHLHALQTANSNGPNDKNISVHTIGAPWTTQGGLVALGVVLGSSISLVGLAFSFITYSLFSDLRSLAGTALLSLLASLFMGQLLFVIGVGGVQDVDLCIAISLALLFMKLATFCWLCCCCHNALTVFRSSANLFLRAEGKMGRTFAQYSLLSWGFPLLMVAVAAAFKYKERDHEHYSHSVDPLVITALNPDHNCWLMKGTAYSWGFLLPAVVLWCTALYLAYHARKVAEISAGMQVDARVRSKLAKRRSLQISLFVRMLMVFGAISLCGAIASIWNVSQFWSLYSIGQGLQGIVTTLLVTCNCKILKLYTTPRLHKTRKGNKYAELRDGGGGVMGSGSLVAASFGAESSRYAVLSVTNPNYHTHDSHNDDVEGCDGDDCDAHVVETGACSIIGDNHRCPTSTASPNRNHHSEQQPQLQLQHKVTNCGKSNGGGGHMLVGYNDGLICDSVQQQFERSQPPHVSRSTLDRLVVDALPVKDLIGGPIPQSV